MTGRHGAPPAGSAAREATASEYHGRHRAAIGHAPDCTMQAGLAHTLCLVDPGGQVWRSRPSYPLPPAPEFDGPFYARDGDDG